MEFVAARRGDDDEHIAVDEVREVVLDGRCLSGCRHTVVFGVEHVVLAARHCGGRSDLVGRVCGVKSVGRSLKRRKD